MDYFERACALKNETIAHRRYLHQHAEVGLHLPLTAAYIKKELAALGCTPLTLGGDGVVTEIGRPGKTVLLRAEVDALPMPDESGLPFACPNGTTGHTCGHDLHGAALLTAAKMLKENEGALRGTVRLLFQPGEETFEGAAAMIKAGLLCDPRPDIAYTGHVTARYPVGTIAMRAGATMASCYSFRILITGKTSHGACPEEGVDPINIGVHIYLAMQELLAREIAFCDKATLTFGMFRAGITPNTIPEQTELQGTLRTFDNALRERLIARIDEIARGTAQVYRGTAELFVNADVPVEYNDPALYADAKRYIGEVTKAALVEEVQMTGSDDFAFITEQIPSVNAFLGARDPAHTGFYYPAHHPRVMFEEDVLPYAAAAFAGVADRWLQEHGE